MRHVSFLACVAASSAFAVVADGNPSNQPSSENIPCAFVVEADNAEDLHGIREDIKRDRFISIRFDLETDDYKAVSVQVQAEKGASCRAKLDKLASARRAISVKPVLRFASRPGGEGEVSGVAPDTWQKIRRALANHISGGDEGAADEAFPPHVMTQVDKLHAKGYTGKGIKVAVIDTGIDYNHPELGGCFGEGCLVSFGANFVGDRSAKPLDCNGHGTFFAGVLAAQPDENPLGFSGVAPGVTLGAYRVTDCSAAFEADAVSAALAQGEKDGADIISMSIGYQSGWPQHPWARIVEGIVKRGVPCVFGAGNDAYGGQPAIGSPGTAPGGVSVTSFTSIMTPQLAENADSVIYEANSKNGGAIDEFHAWGLTWDLQMKPQFGAPGGNILSAFLTSQKSFKVFSGTSYSTPHVSGAYALIMEVRHSRRPDLLEIVCSNTAKPQLSRAAEFRGYLAPPAQQGAGLIQVYDAAFTSTLLRPASLSFNDSDHAVSAHDFGVKNMGGQAVTYNISYVTTKTQYIFERSVINEMATLDFSQSSITLDPGQSATIKVTPSPPQGLDAQRQALWSGWITVNGSDGSSSSLPFHGVAGSMRGRYIFDKDFFPVSVSGSVSAFVATSCNYGDRVFDGKELYLYNYTDTSRVPREDVALKFNLAAGSPLVRVNLFSLTGNVSETDSEVPALGGQWLSSNFHCTRWNGILKSGKPIPKGKYKFAVRALRIFGDAENEADYDVEETETFEVVYVTV